MEQENWKDITGFEGLYQVSNLGNIKSLDFLGKAKFGTRKIQNLRPGISTTKYYIVSLVKDKKANTKKVHRLVGFAFVSNPHNKPFINHIDGNRLNNNSNNLEWCTQGGNLSHAFRIGLSKINQYQKDLLIKRTKERCSIKVLNIKTNEIYDSIKIASESCGMSSSSLSRRLKGEIFNNTYLRYL
jgi:hypothetical protein